MRKKTIFQLEITFRINMLFTKLPLLPKQKYISMHNDKKLRNALLVWARIY